MIEVEALNFIDTFKSYDTFRSEEKAILITKYSALVGTTTDDEFESIYKDTYDFVMQTIYNYYEGYYLTSPTKDRFLSLLGTIVSGKLPVYKVRYDNYINARNIVYDNLTSRESSSSSTGSETGSGEQNYKNNKSGSRSSSGSSKYADTPENINASEDFVDEYTTGQSKDSSSSSHTDTSTTDTNYSNSRSKTGNKSYNETLKGGAKQLWENVQSIPSEIYKEVITITAKLFFSESMEERSYPLAYMTLTRKVEELEEQESKSSRVLGYESILNDECVLHTTILTTQENYETWTDFSRYILSAISTTYDEETHKVQTEWSFRNGMSANDTYTLPLSSLTTDGLMSKEQYSKLDQVVLYGTNYINTDNKIGVRKDKDNDLYVEFNTSNIEVESKTFTEEVTTEYEWFSSPAWTSGTDKYNNVALANETLTLKQGETHTFITKFKVMQPIITFIENEQFFNTTHTLKLKNFIGSDITSYTGQYKYFLPNVLGRVSYAVEEPSVLEFIHDSSYEHISLHMKFDKLYRASGSDLEESFGDVDITIVFLEADEPQLSYVVITATILNEEGWNCTKDSTRMFSFGTYNYYGLRSKYGSYLYLSCESTFNSLESITQDGTTYENENRYYAMDENDIISSGTTLIYIDEPFVMQWSNNSLTARFRNSNDSGTTRPYCIWNSYQPNTSVTISPVLYPDNDYPFLVTSIAPTIYGTKVVKRTIRRR